MLNYMGDQQMSTQTNYKKMVFGFSALAAAVLVIIGIGYAFFSDVINGAGTATAGTLDISGTVTLLQNGVSVGSNITSLNPGDVIEIDGSSITNNGTKSAWIRAVLEFTEISSTNNLAEGICSDTDYTDQATCEEEEETWTPAAADANVGNLADYLWVCTDGEAQADLITASFDNTLGTDATGDSGVDTSSCVPADTTNVFGAKTTYTAPGDVISGSLELDGDIALTTWVPDNSFIIYFDAAAPNAAQNGFVAFDFMIQALQYRNNTTSPNETMWSTVVTAPFAL